MSLYIAHVTPPFPLVGVIRIEVEAPDAACARLFALRRVGTKGSTVSVREVDTSSYAQDFVDSQIGAFA
jgi:hypothetical protein